MFATVGGQLAVLPGPPPQARPRPPGVRRRRGAGRRARRRRRASRSPTAPRAPRSAWPRTSCWAATGSPPPAPAATPGTASWRAAIVALPVDAGRALALVALARRRRRAARRGRLGRAGAAARRASRRVERSASLEFSCVASCRRSSPPSHCSGRLRIRRAFARLEREQRPRRARRSPSTTTATAARRPRRCSSPARRRPTARPAARRPGSRPPTSPRRPSDTACTQIFGGPETATIKGTIRGDAVDASFIAPGRLRDRALGQGRAAARPGHSELQGRRPRAGRGSSAPSATSLDEAMELRAGQGARARATRAAAIDVLGRRYEPGDTGRRADRAQGPRRQGRRRHPRRRHASWPGPAGSSAQPLDADEPFAALRARSERERRPVAAQPGRVLRASPARARPAGARSAASGPSPRGGRPRARRRSRGSPGGASSRRQLNDIAPLEEHDAQRVFWPRIVRPV